MNKMVRIVTTVGLILGTMISSAAYAQEKSFTLELNSAKDNENGCRLTYVAINKTGLVLDKTAYEVVVFDKDGGVSQFLILEFGKLLIGKTKVVQFDLKENKCTDISRLLINEVSECEADGKPVPDCMDALMPKSRTDIGFGL